MKTVHMCYIHVRVTGEKKEGKIHLAYLNVCTKFENTGSEKSAPESFIGEKEKINKRRD